MYMIMHVYDDVDNLLYKHADHPKGNYFKHPFVDYRNIMCIAHQSIQRKV